MLPLGHRTTCTHGAANLIVNAGKWHLPRGGVLKPVKDEMHCKGRGSTCCMTELREGEGQVNRHTLMYMTRSQERMQGEEASLHFSPYSPSDLNVQVRCWHLHARAKSESVCMFVVTVAVHADSNDRKRKIFDMPGHTMPVLRLIPVTDSTWAQIFAPDVCESQQ